MPDTAGSPAGTGFTCTGFAWDAENGEFLLGNIGQDLSTSKGMSSTIVPLSSDFSTVLGEIDLYETFPDMKDIQGLCVDGADPTIWFCSFGEGKVRHITRGGDPLDEICIEQPTGIAYDSRTECLWVLTYSQLMRVNRDGTVQETFDVAVEGQDQLWLDEDANVMYFTGGLNYNGKPFKGGTTPCTPLTLRAVWSTRSGALRTPRRLRGYIWVAGRCACLTTGITIRLRCPLMRCAFTRWISCSCFQW